MKSKITARIGTSRGYAPRRCRLSALLLALAAAFVHALWNLLLARARDPEAATAVALLVGSDRLRPGVGLRLEGLNGRSGPISSSRAVCSFLYFSLLITAYRRAEMSVVSPVARGVAPTSSCSRALSCSATAHRWAQAAGVVLVGLGRARDPGRPGRVPTGSSSGSRSRRGSPRYTLVDKRGLDYATPIALSRGLEIAPALPLRGLGGSGCAAAQWRSGVQLNQLLGGRWDRDLHGVRARARRARARFRGVSGRGAGNQRRHRNAR